MTRLLTIGALGTVLLASHAGGAFPLGALGGTQGPAGRAAEADGGFLDVASDPPAKIVIDDADTGKTTPQAHLELKVGHHKLTLVTPDGRQKRTIGFSIEAGQTTKLTLHIAS